MNVFLPEKLTSWVFLLLEIFTLLSSGLFLINCKQLKWVGWLFPPIAVGSCHYFLQKETAGFRMLALILVLLLAMKIIVAQYFPKNFNLRQWLLFSLVWVGMKPGIFFEKDNSIKYRNLFLKGILFLFAGLAMIFLLKIWKIEIKSLAYLYSSGILLLVSLSWLLHFGLLNINAAFLRKSGYPAYPLFDKPLLSESLQEFWGKRWNLAFTEMTATIVYKPLSKKINSRFALFISFMFSGLLHEVALSLSVQKGYGLPMLYFLLQSLLIASEKRFFKQKKPGRLWVVIWLLIPIPLVFHIYVMRDVFLPIIQN